MSQLADTAKTAGVLIALGASVWGGFEYLDARFVQVAHAEEKHVSLYAELQKRDLRTKIDLVELELSFLDSLEDVTPAQDQEKARLERKLEVLEKHLLELETSLEE